jgi:plasmid stabilization system protein ParE
LVAAKDEALRDLRARVDAIEARLDASEAERRRLERAADRAADFPACRQRPVDANNETAPCRCSGPVVAALVPVISACCGAGGCHRISLR